MERRRHQRCRQLIHITYHAFSDEKVYDAITHDYSRYGMRFISDTPLNIGSFITIRTLENLQDLRQTAGSEENFKSDMPADTSKYAQLCSRELKHMVVAEVKHCRTFREHYRVHHDIGVHFMSPST